MARVYLAARYSRLEEMNGYAEQLRAEGHEVPARWLTGIHNLEGEARATAKTVETEMVSMPLAVRRFAEEDLEDLLASDVLVCFTEHPRAKISRGGRHVEFGVALAFGKRLIVIGPRENVFHTLEEVERFDQWGPEVIDAVGCPGREED